MSRILRLGIGLLALLAGTALGAATQTVHYKTGWAAVLVHYNAGSGWTTAPGEAMTAEGNGWFARTVTTGGSLTFCFNNGSGIWDSNGGQNYTSTAPEVWVKDGVVHTTPPDAPAVSFSPAEPAAGQLVQVAYAGILKDRALVKMHWGYDGWKGVTDTPLVRNESGVWQGSFTVPAAAAATLDAVFTDGANNWDNNGGADYHVTLAAFPADQIPPSVVFVSPAHGTTIAETAVLEATATDNVAVFKVEFYLGLTKMGEAGSAPWRITAAGLPVGAQTLRAVARDTSGNTAEDSVVVTVAGDTVPPQVAIPAPAVSPLSGNVEVAVSASDNVAVARVELFVGTTSVGSDVVSPYLFTINTGNFADGTHVLEAVAYDTAGNSARAVRSVEIRNTSGPFVRVVHYRGDYQGRNVFVQYRQGGLWSAFPGERMAVGRPGWYRWEKTLPAGAVQVRFNYSGGVGDNNAGLGYELVQPTIWVAGKQVHLSDPLVADNPPVITAFGVPAGPVAGSVTLAATATDDVGIAQVVFFLGQDVLGTVTAPPYQVVFDSAARSDGVHPVRVRVTDTAGQSVEQGASLTIRNAVSGTRVNYKTDWAAVNIHYKTAAGWTTPPGEPMNPGTGGWFFKQIGASGPLVFVFNNTVGTWDNNGGKDYACDAPEVWVVNGQVLTTDPEKTPPTVAASPAGGYFTGNSVTTVLSVGGREISAARYTTDGSDPVTSGISFADGASVSLGQGLPLQGVATLRLMAENPYGRTEKSFSFTKVDVIPREPFSWDNATVYFVLTDRFQDGNPANNASYGRVPGSGSGDWHGGDLAGLTQKLNANYFTDLGVNAIWISCPFEQIHGWVVGAGNGFKHWAYHGYYTQDFTLLDQNMGTTNELKAFVAAAHAKGVRVVFDIVMNHAGYNTHVDMDRFQFGTLRPGWQNANLGNYHDFVDYQASTWVNWWGPDWIRAGLPGYDAPGGSDQTMSLAGLPDFKTEATKKVALPAFFSRKPDTRARYIANFTVRDYLVKWITDWVQEYGIDGFRVDTAKHVELDGWQALKSEAVRKLRLWKQANPQQKVDDLDFWMTGEVWGHGVGKSPYFDNGFDSVINFTFQGAAAGALNNLEGIEGTYANYAASINSDPSFNVLSYLSSHDTSLFFAASAGNDPEKQKRAGTLLLLCPGAVQIYYGDETARPIGPECADADQRTRSFMNWPGNAGVLSHWGKVGRFRNSHIAIGAGAHVKLASGPYTFSRIKGNDRVVVALGASGTTAVTVGTVFSEGSQVRDAYSGATATVTAGKATFAADPSGVILIEAVQ